MNYMLIEGDLLESGAKYIAHQTNCLSSEASGIAKVIFEKYPWANIYAPRANYDPEQLPLEQEKPGNIIIKGNKDQRYVINMMGQLYPGGVVYPNSKKDGYIARQIYFKNCLLKIMQIPNLESIAFPYLIGCGIAGGSWETYEKLIDIFAGKMKEKNIETFVYKI